MMSDERTTSMFVALTGDLINSTTLSPENIEHARKLVVKTIGEVETWHTSDDVVIGTLDFFRGDSWQVLMGVPQYAFRVILFVRAKLIAAGFDSRISAGIGTVESVSPKRISMSVGDAFARSGRGLDRMPKDSTLNFSVPNGPRINPELINAITTLAEALVSGWSKRQAELVSLVISPNTPSHEEISSCLHVPISRQSISKVLRSAKWNALQTAIDSLEQIDWQSFLEEPK